jgi:hypothetical protein
MHTLHEQGLVVAVILLNAYCFGANCVERFGSGRRRTLFGWLRRWISCITYLALIRPKTTHLAQ